MKLLAQVRLALGHGIELGLQLLYILFERVNLFPALVGVVYIDKVEILLNLSRGRNRHWYRCCVRLLGEHGIHLVHKIVHVDLLHLGLLVRTVVLLSLHLAHLLLEQVKLAFIFVQLSLENLVTLLQGALHAVISLLLLVYFSLQIHVVLVDLSELQLERLDHSVVLLQLGLQLL